ncbi:hypothetical protein ACA910_018648 [Epithemia clementina (nom. ined.)]
MQLLVVVVVVVISLCFDSLADGVELDRQVRVQKKEPKGKEKKRQRRKKGSTKEQTRYCDSPYLTKWEDYLCSLPPMTELQPQCYPQFVKSNHDNAKTKKKKKKKKKAKKNGSRKSLVVAFHGFTACPDSYREFTEAFVRSGFDVMVPLLPGQGRVQGSCIGNDINTYLPGPENCAGKYQIGDIPINLQGYVDWVAMINEIVVEEKVLEQYDAVYAIGLSMGGPLASFAVNTAPQGLYHKLFLMNPSYAASSPPLDRQFIACQKSGVQDCTTLVLQGAIQSIQGGLANNDDAEDRGSGGIGEALAANAPAINALLVDLQVRYGSLTELEKYSLVQYALRRLLTNTVENLGSLQSAELQSKIENSVYSWGPQCELERQNGRGGICTFRLLNVLAVHSFGQLAHRTLGLHASSQPPRWQMVTVERDSISRNSLSAQQAASVIGVSSPVVKNKRGGSQCMYRVACPLDSDEFQTAPNDCGVPHSMMSRAEQELAGELYWIHDLIQGAVDFFQKGHRYGIVTKPEFPFRKNDRSICQRLPVGPRITDELASDLVLPQNIGVWFRFDPNDKALQQGLVNALAETEATIVAAIVAVLDTKDGQVLVVKGFEILDDNDSGVPELYVDAPATSNFSRLFDLKKLSQFILLDVEIAGQTMIVHG